MKKYLGPIAYRAATILLPVIAVSLGAALLALDADLFAKFCGQV